MHPLFFLYDRAKSSVLKNVFSSTIGETEEVGDDDDDARSVQNLQNVRFIHRGKSIPLAKTDDGVFVVVAVVVLGGAPPSSIDNDDEDFLSCCFFVDDRKNDHSSHASCTEIVAFVPSVFPFKHARKEK
jgi:hypothetical protein